MKKLIVLAAAAAGLLALSATAQAKEVISLKVCGASSCVKTTDQSVLKGWMDEGGNPAQIWQTNPADYYRVGVGFGDQGKLMATNVAYWLPGRSLMRYTDQRGYPWWRLNPAQVKVLRDLAGDLTPLSPVLSRVRVGGKNVSDPSSYLRLLGTFRDGIDAKKHPSVRIALRTPFANPWIHSAMGIRFRPQTRLLVRADGTYRVPKSMARRVMRRVSLATGTATAVSHPAKHGDSTALYAGIGAAGLFGGLGLVVVGKALRKARDS